MLADTIRLASRAGLWDAVASSARPAPRRTMPAASDDQPRITSLMTAKPPATTAARVRAMRARRKLLGLTRVDLYAHPSDHGALKQLAAKLRSERARKT